MSKDIPMTSVIILINKELLRNAVMQDEHDNNL